MVITELQAFEEQSDDAVLQQLMQWTAQLLQRMLRAAEGATRSARVDLEAAVRELIEERKQCASRYRRSTYCSTTYCRTTYCNTWA